MIVIKANVARVSEVAFTGDTAAERAIEAAIWPVIAPFVNRLDRRLRSLNRAVLRELKEEDRSKRPGMS